jgi:hypothetical protein
MSDMKKAEAMQENVKLNHRNWCEYEDFMVFQILPKFGVAGEEIVTNSAINLVSRKPKPSELFYNLHPAISNEETARLYLSQLEQNKIKNNNNSNNNNIENVVDTN